MLSPYCRINPRNHKSSRPKLLNPIMKAEMRDQLDDFLTKFLMMQSSTPPPQAFPVVSATSNMAQVINLVNCFGENSPSTTAFHGNPVMHVFNLSVSP
jgi:hypothetical protein